MEIKTESTTALRATQNSSSSLLTCYWRVLCWAHQTAVWERSPAHICPDRSSCPGGVGGQLYDRSSSAAAQSFGLKDTWKTHIVCKTTSFDRQTDRHKPLQLADWCDYFLPKAFTIMALQPWDQPLGFNTQHPSSFPFSDSPDSLRTEHLW